MSTGLDVSIVTPGSTAPDASFTTPVIVACADASAGSSSTLAATTTNLTTLCTLSSLYTDKKTVLAGSSRRNEF